jgi:ATP-dependent RNA helicase DDX18/HAS1
VLEQLVDCSGGDVINEETGFERKAAALLRVLKEQVRAYPLCHT